jgi:hypothetical protein
MPRHLHSFDRRVFLLAGSAGAAGLAVSGRANAGLLGADRADAFPTTDPERAEEFVGACHGQLAQVKSMLAGDEGLARAAWDWGFGDWETALGAASHTGQIEIIELLLAHGARPDLFTFATLDRIDAVRAVLDWVPNAKTLLGPHGIPLRRHAEAGRAQRVLDYLDSIGLADPARTPTDAAEASRFVGDYAWGPGEEDRFEVAWNERVGLLSVRRPGRSPRNLFSLGGPSFSPAGAPHAVLRFEAEGDTVVGLSLTGVGPVVRALRVAG